MTEDRFEILNKFADEWYSTDAKVRHHVWSSLNDEEKVYVIDVLIFRKNQQEVRDAEACSSSS